MTVVGRTFRDDSDNDNDTFPHRIKFIPCVDLGLMSESDRIANELIELNAQNAFTHVIFTVGITASPEREETSEGLRIELNGNPGHWHQTQLHRHRFRGHWHRVDHCPHDTITTAICPPCDTVAVGL